MTFMFHLRSTRATFRVEARGLFEAWCLVDQYLAKGEAEFVRVLGPCYDHQPAPR